MKILFLGGTRFLGLLLLEKLSKKGFDLTVLSRRKVENMSGVIFLQGEKNNLLPKLSDVNFDIVIDFISYQLDDIRLNHDFLTFKKYYFISSVWLSKIAPNQPLDKPIVKFDTNKLNKLPEITQKYLLGKLQIENFIIEKSRIKNKYNIIRLPVFLGKKDHTKRIHYYIERVIDSYDVLLLNNGATTIQIAWVKDLANLLSNFLINGGEDHLIWEAVPQKSIKILDVYHYIEEAFNKQNRFRSKDLKYFINSFPEYLEYEPFWREEKFSLSDHNLFDYSDRKSTEYKYWLKKIAKEIYQDEEINATEIRKKEINHLEVL